MLAVQGGRITISGKFRLATIVKVLPAKKVKLFPSLPSGQSAHLNTPNENSLSIYIISLNFKILF